MGPGMKLWALLNPRLGNSGFICSMPGNFCFPVTTCAVIVNFLLQHRSASLLPRRMLILEMEVGAVLVFFSRFSVVPFETGRVLAKVL